LREQVVVDDETVGKHCHPARVVQQRPLQLERPGDVRAREKDLTGAAAGDHAEVAADLGECRGEPGKPCAVEIDVPHARARQVDR
jgi:hypothetical protein